MEKEIGVENEEKQRVQSITYSMQLPKTRISGKKPEFRVKNPTVLVHHYYYSLLTQPRGEHLQLRRLVLLQCRPR